MIMLILDQIYFNAQIIIKKQEVYIIMIIMSIHQEDKSILVAINPSSEN
jgi:hypothetical protein